MTTNLISPSEVKLAEKLKGEAIVSPLPEEKGADILTYTQQGLLGIQLKEVPNDFISSVTDGRLARETSLLPKSCKFSLLLLRGRFKYWPDSRLITGAKEPSRFTKKQIQGLLFNVRYVKGVDYDYVEDMDDVVFYLRTLTDWLNSGKHYGLFVRPGGPKGTWIVPTVEETQSWVLQGFQGIGPALADAIITHFGKIPLAWTCQFEELVKVPRLSTKRAKILWETLSMSVPASKESGDYELLRKRLGIG